MNAAPRRCRTYRYRLHPTVRQSRALGRQLNYQRELFNAALEERIGAWKWGTSLRHLRGPMSHAHQSERSSSGGGDVWRHPLPGNLEAPGSGIRWILSTSAKWRTAGFPTISLGPSLGLYAVGGLRRMEGHRRPPTPALGHRRDQDELLPAP
ncbi:MAG: helix-turn-helix domain-containing protein [Acidimicrobiales bacterium]